MLARRSGAPLLQKPALLIGPDALETA